MRKVLLAALLAGGLAIGGCATDTGTTTPDTDSGTVDDTGTGDTGTVEDTGVDTGNPVDTGDVDAGNPKDTGTEDTGPGTDVVAVDTRMCVDMDGDGYGIGTGCL